MPRIVRILFFTLAATSTSQLFAALPELSSIEPLVFDEGEQRLIARGEARLDVDNTRIQADEITYYQEYGLADALGNVAISRDGGRLIADRMSFDTKNNSFSVDVLRTGQWPYYLSGVNAGGSEEQLEINGSTVYYGDPGPFGLSVSSPKVEYIQDGNDRVKMHGATLRIGNVPFFYLPTYTYYVGTSPYYLNLNGGIDNELGVYLQSTTLFPITSWLRVGANLDYYSKRGALAGPTAQYVYNSQQHRIVGAISTGGISDSGSTDFDILGNEISSNRGFAEWRHKHHIGERFTATAQASYWSDSEVTRDFREDFFSDNQNPDTFAEGVYAGDNFLVSAFGRFRPNEFQLIQERLPEVRFDLLPVPIFKTGAYHRASLSYVRLEEDFSDVTKSLVPTLEDVNESDRMDLTYRIERPFRVTNWLTFTPLAGARVTQYDNQAVDTDFSAGSALTTDSFTREIYEVGFDLEARAYASYPTINETWDIDGLRHLVRPVIRYRYYSDPDSLNEIVAIDREAFTLDRPVLNLSDLRNVDTIAEAHLVRLGVENLFQTRAKGYGSRTLAELNFYQDVLFDKNTRYDGDEENTFNATWVEFVLQPAPWLKFDLASRFKTESLTLEELRTRTSIVSGEIWEIGLSTDLLNNQIDQYRLDFIYRINERYSFLTDARFDAETGDFTKFSIGVATRIGSTWQVLYALTFRQDARRESDIEFNISVKLAQP
ncbi:MAG: LPS-assembly protein LptD [Opitutaceae bacterium]